MGTQAYCIYARLNLFPEDSTRSREQIFGHDIATRSRRHRHIVWIFDDISELFYRATNRIIRVYTLSSSSKEVSYSNDENWLIRSRDRLITRWNLGNLSISKKGIFPRERFFTRSRSIFVFTGMKNTRYRDAYTWSMPSEKRGNCVGSRANGCVISLLIAPAADLIQPRNRCLGRVLTGR